MPSNPSGRAVKGVVWNCLISEIAGSKAWMFVSFVLCRVGSGLCDGLITGIDESYHMYVFVCVF